MQKDFFKKRFLIGLTLDTTIDELDAFLENYSYYIDEIYFSLPLGEKFQSRKAIHDQFLKTEKVDLFWQLLNCIKKHNMKLELVLNTIKLNKTDIDNSFELLKIKKVDVDSVSIIDDYYDWVMPYISTQKLVCSYNNGIRSISALGKIKNQYDVYVIGNAAIRDIELHRHIHENLGKQVSLLLNNGCSFNCGWCGRSKNCRDVFMGNLSHTSIEQLYAMQSVFPHELRNGVIQHQFINTFKISNRTSSLVYLQKCLDSYINDECFSFVQKNVQNYSLWCRLAWFHPYFEKMDYTKIMHEKGKIKRKGER